MPEGAWVWGCARGLGCEPVAVTLRGCEFGFALRRPRSCERVCVCVCCWQSVSACALVGFVCA